MIIGIDEVGRGPWAGPLVVGAVILDGVEIDGLNDSKKLTKKRREALDMIIRDQAMAWALGWVSAHELDEVGMSQALRLATRRAVEQIQAQCREKSLAVDQIIIDGTVNFLADTALEKYVTVMAKADGLVPSVSAASIIAKVARDAYMSEQGQVYPGYGFASHSGYGTAKHRAAIERLGVTPLHRLSFAPLAKYAEAGSLPSSARVHSSLASLLEMSRERSAETSAPRERFTAPSAEDGALIAVFSGDEARRLYETLPTTLSRVVPASRATMAVRARVKRLNNELLPTLAWPMMATVGNLLGIIMPIITEARRFGEDKL